MNCQRDSRKLSRLTRILMILSLDTHVFLWWLDEPERLTARAHKAIEDSSSVVYVSAAVSWEIAVKRAAGNLKFPHAFEEVLKANGFLPLPITTSQTLRVGELPLHHKD